MTRMGCESRSCPLRLPWWGSILMAILVYCGLMYGVPELHLSNPTLQMLAQAAPSFAPILAIPWLLLAGKQLYDNDDQDEKENISQKEKKPPAE
jgi:hypothetical protein